MEGMGVGAEVVGAGARGRARRRCWVGWSLISTLGLGGGMGGGSSHAACALLLLPCQWVLFELSFLTSSISRSTCVRISSILH